MNDEILNTHKFISTSCISYFESFELTERQGKLDESLLVFCNDPSENTAKEVYKAFLYTFRLPGLEEVINALQRFEVTSSRLISSHRDHYIHTVNVFLLGLSFFACNKTVQKAASSAMDYQDKYPSTKEEFLYRWGMASLFHDVGYPLEIGYKTIHEFTTMLISPNLGCKEGNIISLGGRKSPSKPIVTLRFMDIEDILYVHTLLPDKKCEDKYYRKYPHLKTALPNDLLFIIAKNIATQGFANTDTIYRKLRNALLNGLEDGLLDHGIYSSIIFLKWINEAFSKAGWNPAYYYIPVVDSATAILLHNAYDYVFQTAPFNLGPLDIKNNLLGFLLILCDRIQEMDRVSYGYIQKDNDFTSSCLSINDNEFVLRFFIPPHDDENLAKLKVSEMEKSIQKTIALNSVFKIFKIELGQNKF